MTSGTNRRRARRAGRAHDAEVDRRVAPRDRTAIYWSLAVGLSAVVVYLTAFGNDFVVDDIQLIRDNLRIRSLDNVPHLFVSSYWGTGGAQALYRPLVLATYAINYAIHGLTTYGYTAVNVGLHAAVSLLVFALVRAMGGPLLAAGVSGIAFAVHPVHSEAVAGISGRPELLAAFFFLLALHFHRQVRRAGRRPIVNRAATLACFACALLSKESAMTLVAVLPIMDELVPLEARGATPPTRLSRVVTDYLPTVLVAAAYLALRHRVLGDVLISTSLIAPLDNPLGPITTNKSGRPRARGPGQAIMTVF